ncbi:DUF4065 domain-containing protein [Fructobacillus sp. M1-13]|uniref:DUF4065 domain-containing protein n=1 Tax=Fructobacillus papyriferae TaxID=2713171 RepID=A0ABS5QTD5_9LACO|nr:type II toxin-antitoxin system antitoxin SocA domain-containing protein [Fructobacillus papyriferae]MBS9335579.1 DUF4065 domain-containing protein [Fructobacillus papyriferae]MCD2159331.1 DUF4065 domain-containing protein [Fructobacillus papyriferae]
MAEYTALQVTNWFRATNYADMQHKEMVEPLSQMKVMKLLYYAQGVMLAAYDRKLFSDDIVCWKYGPAVESVHAKYKGQKEIVPFDSGRTLSDTDLDDFQLVAKDDDAVSVLSAVMVQYGDKSAIDLMNMTHHETPWKETKQSSVISPRLIKDYFNKHILA